MTGEVTQKINDFFASYRLRTFPKGQVLLLAGDECENIFYLVSGKVKEYDVSYKGDEVILNVFKPYAFFPMSLAINKTKSLYIYEAESTIEVRQVPAQEVIDFVKQNPDVLYDLLDRVYRGVNGILSRMSHLMVSNAHDRVVYELILEAQRFGTPSEDGNVRLTINEKDLAARAGLTRETVSREVAKLKVQKIISIIHGVISISSLTALEKILEKRN